MTTLVKEEFRKYAESTSIRGVGRSLRTQDKRLRIIWICAVIISLSMTIWQLNKVFVKYFSYQTVSTMKEVYNGMKFPAVTVCNTSPLGDKENANLQWINYITMVEQRKSLMSAMIADDPTLEAYSNDSWLAILSDLQSPPGYFANLPLTDSGGSGDNFIVDCGYYNWDWQLYTGSTPQSSFDCFADTVKFVWDNNYYHCVSFQMPMKVAKKIRGLTAIFYINDFTSSRVDAFRPTLGVSRATGIQVSVSAPGTVSNMKVAESIAPGTESSIRLTQTKRVRLPKPYGTCINPYYIATDEPSRQEWYTSEKCIGLCMQQQIIDACGCVTGDLPFNYTQFESVGNRLCSNQSLLLPNVVDDRNAILNFAARIVCAATSPARNDICDCPEPCTEYTYDTYGIGSPWPHKSYKLAFYNTYIAPHPEIYGSKFDAYAQIQAQVGQVDDDVIMAQIQNTTLIAQNFLQLNVLFYPYTSLQLDDLPAMTVELLAANIGGSLSLWLGITTMAGMEVIELIYRVILSCYQSRQKKRASEETVNNPQEVDLSGGKQKAGVAPVILENHQVEDFVADLGCDFGGGD